jgi:3-hydroxybutyryl-CoA dehydrogenase
MEKVGIIGSGQMGTGIAYLAARQLDAEIVVVDIGEQFLEKSRANIEALAARAVEKTQVTRDVADAWLKKLSFSTDRKDVKGASVVIEAVPEDLSLKCKLFGELDEICGEDGTILATNTTALPVTEIAAATRRPERVIGMHFFNPAPVMKLVEIVCGHLTSKDIVAKTTDFCTRLGKETIVVNKDFPGFVTSRILNGYMAEALQCLEQGISSVEDIDKGCKLAFNHPLGPFELMDFIGLDTVLALCETLQVAYGERFRPSLALRQLVGAGRLGRKSGAGFYTYPAKAKGA